MCLFRQNDFVTPSFFAFLHAGYFSGTRKKSILGNFRENALKQVSVILQSQSTRGSKIFGNGQKQPYLKLCPLKASHEQVIKSTLFCLLILMWSRDGQFKFDPPGSNFGSKNFPKFTNFACLLSKQTLANHKSNDVSLLN